ncbi:MAG: choice-of-anchor Q domain-containing protein [Bacteroidota bacterium]
MNKNRPSWAPSKHIVQYCCTLTILLFSLSFAQANTIFVNVNATGINNGRSWQNAFTNLQDALSEAKSNPSVSVIWVAAGTYYPSDNGDRAASFELLPGIAIYGGFDGTESTLAERNPTANPSILSGNIGDPSIATDNSYHVVLALNITDENTALDGFVIQDGQADGSGLFGFGGGFFNLNNNSSGKTAYFRIRRLTFRDNYGKAGGALCNYSENDVHDSLIVERCNFLENQANNGGAVANYKADKGQMECAYLNCTFSRNSASVNGGAAFNIGSTGQIISQFKYNVKYIGCTFWENTARNGAGLYIADNASKFSVLSRNCSFYGNDAIGGSDAVCVGDNGSIQMGNIIAWNGSAIRSCSFLSGDNVITVNNSLIENSSYNDFQNITDPTFVDPANGDLRISACSPLIDQGINYNLPIATDIDGNPRMNGAFLDLGAYEFAGNPIGLPVPDAPSITAQATEEVTDRDGWTHYYSCDAPEHLILSILKEGQDVGSLGQAGFAVQAVTNATFGQGGLNRSTADYLPTAADGWTTFNRYWQVLNAKPLTSPVKVRFYFTDTDFSDIQAALVATNTPTLIDETELRFFLISGAMPLATNVLSSGGSYTPLEFALSSSETNWTLGSFNGRKYAEFVVSQLSGGSAGAESLTPLPVEFESFTAELIENDKVRLDWATASEENNDYFIVERSHDAKEFYPILHHPSLGNGQVTLQYQLWDYSPHQGINYYRLKQVDLDGQYSYSSVSSVYLDEDGKQEARMYPNPTTGRVSIQLPLGLEGEVKLQLYDAYRKIIWEEKIQQANPAVMARDFSHLPAGLYVLKIRGKRYRTYHPLVLSHLD